ncbi:MAG TPA: glycosyltransferase, partial [Mycobacteriales bacterium]|nr:glycosyltransferase [Mycobacteriales bacterium]
MRVLHVIPELGPGGAEHQLRLLLPRLPVDSAVVTLGGGSLVDPIRATGVPVTDLGGGRLGPLPALVRLVRRGRYDLVHTHRTSAALYGRAAARAAGGRAVVATEHALGRTHVDGRPVTAGLRRAYRLSARLGSATIAVSEPVADRLADWHVDRVVVIPAGLDPAELAFDPALRAGTRAALGLWPSERVIGAVGRLDRGSRFDVLLRAVAGLDATLLLVGDGPLRAELEALAGGLGLADRIRFLGPLADLCPVLCAVDVLAAPSAEEGFGLTVLAGLACGLPAVHAGCPALEALPPGAAPGTVRGAVDEHDLRAELAAVLDTAGGSRA